jgi:hypothetical protein
MKIIVQLATLTCNQNYIIISEGVTLMGNINELYNISFEEENWVYSTQNIYTSSHEEFTVCLD